jgi:hypothetical protein
MIVGTWVSRADRAIIDFYYDKRIACPPRVVHFNLMRRNQEYVYEHIKRRMWKLEMTGILENVDEDRGYYVISDLGISLSEGELSREEINDLEPDD